MHNTQGGIAGSGGVYEHSGAGVTTDGLALALNGSLPPTQDALVEAQILSERSTRFEITAEGAIVPAPGSPCV